MAALAEFGGGLLLILGLFTHPAAFLLLATMTIALIKNVSTANNYDGYVHPLKLVFVFAALLAAGGGCYALDRWLYTKPNAR